MEAATATKIPPRLKERYESEIAPALQKQFGYANPMEIPRVQKVTLNMGVGEAKQDSKMLDAAQEQLAIIAGQHPNVRVAKKSIANFKLRDGMPVGLSVTLRSARMWEFLDRLMSIAIPRIRDFRGLNPRSFDGRGNWTLGVREQVIFPEIDYDAVDQVRGLDISITTTAKTDEEAFALLLALGMPFAEDGRPGAAQAEPDAEEEERRHEEARARAEAERQALEQLKEENPEAYEKPERPEEGDEDGEGTPQQRLQKGTSNGQDLTARAPAAHAQVQDPRVPPLPQVRPPARLHAQVRPVPHLPARPRPRGRDPRAHQEQLVAMQTDPIADFLTRIRNGLQADHDAVVLPASKLKTEMARILTEQGYVESWELEPGRVGQSLRVTLKYTEDRKPVISGMERISKPGRRRYVASGEVPKVLGGMGTSIVSTSRGVMTGHDCRRNGVGGELVARVW